MIDLAHVCAEAKKSHFNGRIIDLLQGETSISGGRNSRSKLRCNIVTVYADTEHFQGGDSKILQEPEASATQAADTAPRASADPAR